VTFHAVEQMPIGILVRLAPVHKFRVSSEPEGAFV
jgi:hypothetical protein